MSEQNEYLNHVKNHYQKYTYDMFMMNMSAETEEMELFSAWLDTLNEKNINGFEAVRQTAQTPEVEIVRQSGTKLSVLNFSSYNYLGFGYHPLVIEAAQQAVAKYGIGAASSPVISGTYEIHRQFEEAICKFFAIADRGVSLFSSGYGVNLGVIQAFAKPGSHIVLDQAAHMSLIEGAKLSGAKVSYFAHNDMFELEKVLEKVCDSHTRVLVCVEGIYSGDGDYGNIKDVVKLAKKYGAYTLVDEAHSVLIAGENGRGVCEDQGVLEEVDLYVMTFSKSFGGVGGAVLAHKNIINYINWYAKCRMFSCALDPAVTGGMLKVMELAGSEEGQQRRKRLKENFLYLKTLLQGKVNLGQSNSWILTVVFGKDDKTLEVNNYLQNKGLDTSILQFPAVPKNEARIRMFVTSEHSKEQLEKAANIIIDAAKEYDFLLN